MKILLTGRSGLLGSAVADQAAARGAVCHGWAHTDIALKQPQQLSNKMEGYDWLIHCAANTDVEDCEKDPAACYRDNYLLTDMLARAAAAASIPMAFVSSTGVYGRHKVTPYREYDATEPTTHHHRSKLLAEGVVLSQASNLVIRTGWLFGGEIENPKNFVARRIAEAKKGLKLQSNQEQQGVPSFTEDVAHHLLELMERGFSGVFNSVNNGNASRYEYVQEILRIIASPTPIEPVSANHFKRLALVSNNEMAENWRSEQAGFPPLPSWQTSLAHYIQKSGITEKIIDGPPKNTI